MNRRQYDPWERDNHGNPHALKESFVFGSGLALLALGLIVYRLLEVVRP